MRFQFVIRDAPSGSKILGIPLYRHAWSEDRIGQIVAEIVEDDADPSYVEGLPGSILNAEDYRSEKP